MVRGGVAAPAVAPRTRLSLAFSGPNACLAGSGRLLTRNSWGTGRGGRCVSRTVAGRGDLASVHPPLRLLTRGLWVV